MQADDPNDTTPPPTATRGHALAVTVRAAALMVPVTAARGLQALARRLIRLALRGADPETAQRMTDWSYDHDSEYGDAPVVGAGWLAFEQAAIAAWFPAVPARILVPGCGGGREMCALLADGYACAGFDPVPRFVATARTSMPGAAVAVGSLQRLPGGLPFQGPFDAVLVGWGAWGFVLTETDRIDAMKELRRRCPVGPILLSWNLERPAALRGDAETLAAVTSGVGGGKDWRDRVALPAKGRIQARLGRAEVVREATAAGERVAAYGTATDHGYAHAVLLPVDVGQE